MCQNNIFLGRESFNIAKACRFLGDFCAVMALAVLAACISLVFILQAYWARVSTPARDYF